MTILWILVLSGLVGAIMGDDDCCSIEDRREIQKAWYAAWGAQDSGRRLAIGAAVFKDMFEQDPASKSLFTRVKGEDLHSPEFQAHMMRVIGGLDLIINLLTDPATLDQQLEHLAKKHIDMKSVTKEHFAHIGKSFSRVLPKASSCFNSDAWNRCFHRLAHGLTHGLP